MGIQETLKALSDPVRRQILEHLKRGRMPAGQIAELFDISAPAVSRHLSVLKDAGLVRVLRAEGIGAGGDPAVDDELEGGGR